MANRTPVTWPGAVMKFVNPIYRSLLVSQRTKRRTITSPAKSIANNTAKILAKIHSRICVDAGPNPFILGTIIY